MNERRCRDIRVVENVPEYWDFIRRLRCDPRVQDAFIETANISVEQQTAYMSQYGQNYLVGLVDGEPAGYVGSIDRDIRVCVHPDFHGLGVGRKLIQAIMERFPNSIARIKIGNSASLRLFESCGFEPMMVVMSPRVGHVSAQ